MARDVPPPQQSMPPIRSFRDLLVWQMLEHVPLLVDLAALHQRPRAEHLGHGAAQPLPAVHRDEDAAVSRQPPLDEISQHRPAQRRVLGAALSEGEHPLAAARVDAAGGLYVLHIDPADIPPELLDFEMDDEADDELDGDEIGDDERDSEDDEGDQPRRWSWLPWR